MEFNNLDELMVMINNGLKEVIEIKRQWDKLSPFLDYDGELSISPTAVGAGLSQASWRTDNPTVRRAVIHAISEEIKKQQTKVSEHLVNIQEMIRAHEID